MYIHKQGHVRYRTLCEAYAPDRAITTDSQSVSCPNCIVRAAPLQKKFFDEVEITLAKDMEAEPLILTVADSDRIVNSCSQVSMAPKKLF
jgi:hypothetical protein